MNSSPVFEIAKFADGRLMVRVRFQHSSNFWIHDLESASWVPRIDEVETLKEIVEVVNERNEIKKTLRLHG
jgi:hypothetical protein